jgi:hypothetical protein
MTLRIAMSVAVLVLLPLGAIEAAPQALGVAASLAPTPLVCKGKECSAQVGAFCLQRERDVPPGGAAYVAADPRLFTLVATRADGSVQRLAGAAYISFASAFGYSSVRISVPRQLLDDLGAVALAVEVAPEATLLPVAAADDPNPLTPEEAQHVAGPLRHLAAKHFDQPGTVREAAHLVEELVNGLPGGFRDTVDKRQSVWDRQITPALEATMAPEAVAIAREAFETCLGHSWGMRQCLEYRHMNLLSDPNRAYWAEVEAGS